MDLTKTFSNVKFSVTTIRAAADVVARHVRQEIAEEMEEAAPKLAELERLKRAEGGNTYVALPIIEYKGNSEPTSPAEFTYMDLVDGHGSWSLDEASEWFAGYRHPDCLSASVNFETTSYRPHLPDFTFRYERRGDHASMTSVRVRAPKRDLVMAIMDVFEEAEESARIPPPPEPPSTPSLHGFLGHGRAEDWRQLHHTLVNQFGYSIDAFESGARAGHHIRDILEGAARSADFALIVMTGEDATTDARLRARQNVVHEAGLFQGALGFNRAVLVVEDGIEMLSNLDGIQQVRFPKGNIAAAEGGVLAFLRREFGDAR